MKRFKFEHPKNFTVFDDQDVEGLSDYVWIGSSQDFIESHYTSRLFF